MGPRTHNTQGSFNITHARLRRGLLLACSLLMVGGLGALWRGDAAADELFVLPGEKREKPKRRARKRRRRSGQRSLAPIYGPPKEWQSFRSTSRITCAVRDGSNLWAGTSGGGLIRWNLRNGAYRFFLPRDKNSKARRITSIAMGRGGDLWVGTKGYGVAQVKPGRRRWKWYRYKNGLPNNRIRGVTLDDRGHVWVATKKGAARWNGKRWRKYTISSGLPDGDLRAIGKDSRGRIWFSPNISNPFYYDGRKFRRLSKFPVTGSTCIVPDRKGGVWFCNDQGAVYHSSTRTKLYNTTHGLAGPIAQSIYVDAGGGVWIGTKTAGLSYFRQGRWTTLNRRQGLPGLDIRAIVGGPSGSILAATFLNGVARYRARRWSRLGIGIVGNEIHAIRHHPDGSVWVGTSSGASRYKKGYWYNYSNQFQTPDVRSFLFSPTGATWLGTFGGGLSRFEGRRWKTYDLLSGLKSNRVVGAWLSPEGMWFIHEQKGATLYTGSAWKSYNERNTNSLLDPAYPVSATHMDKDLTLYIGSKGGGVITRTLRGRWRRIGYMVGAGGRGVIYGITSDSKGNVWFATKAGLYRKKGSRFKRFTKRNGLPSTEVLAVAAEGQKIWVGTKKGVACYDGMSWRSFTRDMGLVSNKITVISISPTGEKWFGSPMDGLTIYRGE